MRSYEYRLVCRTTDDGAGGPSEAAIRHVGWEDGKIVSMSRPVVMTDFEPGELRDMIADVCRAITTLPPLIWDWDDLEVYVGSYEGGSVAEQYHHLVMSRAPVVGHFRDTASDDHDPEQYRPHATTQAPPPQDAPQARFSGADPVAFNDALHRAEVADALEEAWRKEVRPQDKPGVLGRLKGMVRRGLRGLGNTLLLLWEDCD